MKEKIRQPSLCAHKRNRIEGNKQTCLRCGRIRIETDSEINFYWDGNHYFTLQKNHNRAY